MEHVAAYIMLTKTGRDVTTEAMKNLFGAIDAPISEGSMSLFLSAVQGKNMEDVMADGEKLMSSFAVAAPAASAVPEVAKPAEVKKAEPEEEEMEIDFGFF